MKKPVSRTLALAAALAMVTTAPAMAAGSEDNDANRDADLPHVNYSVDGDEIELEFVNPTDFAFSFDYRVDGEPEGTEDQWTGEFITQGPLEGQDFGLRYEVVTLDGEGSETVTVTADSEAEVRLARGAEQEWYFDWITIAVEPVDEPEEPEEPVEPTSKQDCKNGGWTDTQFRNQGQCIASIVANERSVHGQGN